MIDERLAKALEAHGFLWEAHGSYWYRKDAPVGTMRLTAYDRDFLDRFPVDSIPLVLASGQDYWGRLMTASFGWSHPSAWWDRVGIVYLTIRMDVGV
jgi:hypothetical protein